MKNFFKQLFFGYNDPNVKFKPALKNHRTNFKRVWSNTSYNDFGIERLVRLFLICIQYIFPALYIKNFTGKKGLLVRKLVIDLYVIFKMFLPIIFFSLNLTDKPIILFITIYMLSETILYLLSLIFLSDIYAKPITYKRSLLLLFINFIEIGLEYAVILSYFNHHTDNLFSKTISSPIDIIYFSFVSFQH